MAKHYVRPNGVADVGQGDEKESFKFVGLLPTADATAEQFLAEALQDHALSMDDAKRALVNGVDLLLRGKVSNRIRAAKASMESGKLSANAKNAILCSLTPEQFVEAKATGFDVYIAKIARESTSIIEGIDKDEADVIRAVYKAERRKALGIGVDSNDDE